MLIHEHPSLEFLVLFTDGGLSPVEDQEVAAHIDDCPDCALEIAVATQLRDFQAENLIAYPGPARREAGARRLRALAPFDAGGEPGPQSPTGIGPFGATAFLSGAIGTDALAHLLGLTAEPALPMAGGFLGHHPGPLAGFDGEGDGPDSGEPSPASHAPEIEKNPDRDVRNEGEASSRSTEGEAHRHEGLDALIEEARALFSEAAEDLGHGHVDNSVQANHWHAIDDLAPDPSGGHGGVPWHVVDTPGLVDPMDSEGSSHVGPDEEPGYQEDQAHPDDHGPHGLPHIDDHHTP
jgi:hypothetical protein